ncbi:Major facilitator superfamily [Thalictrum thalictroides]|uniref:Major facilitator superfamily n=1 Tax=Thalictrum thalictroides TaxID=46969 RepID=A0A7J6VFS1_THATH|nr:Major facilitator superfamily [Thalictrum thalictroides]
MKNADMMFGGITSICEILGTLPGGIILDRVNSTINNAFKLLTGATFLGAVFCFSAFLYEEHVCLRPLSMALPTILIHICGDVPSSPLVGALQDHVNNWRTTALSLTAILFLAAGGVWFIGIFLHSVDKFNEDSKHNVSTVGNPTEVTESAEP